MEASSLSMPQVSRWVRIKGSMTPREWRHAGGMAAVIAGLHVVGFGILILVVAPAKYKLGASGTFAIGTGVTAYTLGLRHAFDADHISAIDNTTRKMMGEGKRPLSVGFFFSLGHSTIVFALGAAIEFLLLRRLKGADIDTTMLVMIGAWIALQNVEQFTWSGVAKSIDTPFPFSPLVLGPVSVSWNRLFVFAVAIALIAGSYALINRTRLGKAMRATFQDRETAALMGVDINFIHTATFALGSGLAAAAGALLGPVFVVYPSMGDLASLKAFAIVILGGLGSIPGATIGGFILAFMEELGAGYVSSGFRDGMGFLLIIAILIFKPTGLFAQKERIG